MAEASDGAEPIMWPEPDGAERAADPEVATGRRHHVSRWDRPPPPKDWRYAVGLAGKVLVVTGLLLFGFVAYQLWGTGLETARAQRRLEREFEAMLATVPAPSTTAVATTTVATTTVATTAPATTGSAPATVAPTTVAPTTVPPSTTAPTTTTMPGAVDQDIPPIELGDPIAHIEIPDIGVAKWVVAGVGVEELKKGPGHFPDTPMPGQLGNAAIAGHRTTYGQPFRDIDELQPADRIVVTTFAGRFVYAVTGTEIVSPSDYAVVATTDPEVAELTLTSCHPVFSASQRIIVHSELVVAESSPVGRPVFYRDRATGEAALPGEGAAPAATAAPLATPVASTVPGETAPEGTAPETTPAATAPAATTPEETTPEERTPDTTEVTGPDAIAPPTDGQGVAGQGGTLTEDTQDAFSGGWFHDGGAWPHVALWGVVVGLIAVGSYLLARRVRNGYVGIAVGAVPFLVGLFFLYQNVNRLLPPGI